MGGPGRANSSALGTRWPLPQQEGPWRAHRPPPAAEGSPPRSGLACHCRVGGRALVTGVQLQPPTGAILRGGGARTHCACDGSSRRKSSGRCHPQDRLGCSVRRQELGAAREGGSWRAWTACGGSHREGQTSPTHMQSTRRGQPHGILCLRALSFCVLGSPCQGPQSPFGFAGTYATPFPSHSVTGG